MQIETKRFILRDFSPTDSRSFVAYHADSGISQFYTHDQATPEHAQHLLALFHGWATAQPRENYQLAVVQRQPPYALVGCAGLRGAGLPPHEAEFGLELAPDYQRRYAYAVEIGRALLDFGFGQLDLHVISGATVSANKAITRLAEWFGAEVVAERPIIDSGSGQSWSRLEWRITRAHWRRQQSKSNSRNAGPLSGPRAP